MRVSITLTFLGILSILLPSCEGPDTASRQVSFSTFVGTYQANFGSASLDELYFFNDSSYIYKYISKTGEFISDTGYYEFIDPGRQSYIAVLEEFPIHHPESDRCLEMKQVSDGDRIRLIMRVVRTSKKQYLEFCPHEFKYYIKQ